MKKLIANIKKHWYVPLLIPVLIWSTVKLFNLLKRKPTSETENAEDALDKIGVPTLEREFIKSTCIAVAHNLGTKYDWWDPRSWSENDLKVYNLLKGLSQKQFDQIADLYFMVYAKGNDLSADLIKVLDVKYYSQLKVR